MVIREKSLIKHKEINLDSIVYIKYVKKKNFITAHTIHTLISDLFGVVKSCGLRGEGRRDLEEGLRYGVV